MTGELEEKLRKWAKTLAEASAKAGEAEYGPDYGKRCWKCGMYMPLHKPGCLEAPPGTKWITR